MPQWFMIRNCRTNEYDGPFDEERAKKEVIERCNLDEVDYEALPLGTAVYTARWKGVVLDDHRKKFNP